MKIKKNKILILTLLILLVINVKSGFSQQNNITIYVSKSDKQILFAEDEIKKAAEDNGYILTVSKTINTKSTDGIIIKIISDSASIVKIAKTDVFELPKQFGWQCYSIRVKVTGNQKIIYILSGDITGAMYGGLDVAEAIRLKTINFISDSDHKPYIERRGIKWNMPLDLRTPNYADNGDHYQENISNIWELDFWHQLIDEMVRSRLNIITIHSINPFPSIVKIPEFPEIALNDVHRTKAKLGPRSNSGSGRELVTPEMLNNYEIVKKITIDEKIKFWREVMEYAHNRGIEFVWFTWNIFTYGIEGKYGIDNSQDNENTIKYYRSAVREMVLTYPYLSGIGIAAGENMERNSTYSKEEWLWKTYGQGISDALKIQTDRKFRLIHRFHQADLTEILNEFKNYPGPFDLSYKYAWAHMYSIPDPPYIKSIIGDLSPELKTFLELRNDDIYSFRWGNPTFARQFILSIPEPEKIAGYYVGGYWAKDVIEKEVSSHPLSIQKRWYETMLWGRLGYDPNLKDSLFLKSIGSRFKGIPSQTMMDGWSAASMIFPWITRFAWGGNDFEWFPEACFRNPDRYEGGFITVKDFMDREPQQGSNISHILRWAENFEFNSPDSLMSPLAVADTLSKYAKIALINLNQLAKFRGGSSNELNLTLGDIEAFASIGNYYSEKIRGACSLALFNFYGLKQDQDDAIQHLENAKAYWEEYATIYSTQYKPALFSRIGFINIPELIEKTTQDIEIAIDWKPGTIKGYEKGRRRTP